MSLILASASPRRAALLKSAGVAFDVQAADVDETPRDREEPEALVCRLSAAKAEAIAAAHPDATILAADTVVVFDGEIFGKPETPEEAVEMLTLLSGDQHEVMTGFTLLRPGAEAVCELVVTEVSFRELSEIEIQAYVDSGEPMDKAGAYGIQAGAAGFVSRIEGSYTNVVGLPVAEVMMLIAES